MRTHLFIAALVCLLPFATAMATDAAPDDAAIAQPEKPMPVASPTVAAAVPATGPGDKIKWQRPSHSAKPAPSAATGLPTAPAEAETPELAPVSAPAPANQNTGAQPQL